MAHVCEYPTLAQAEAGLSVFWSMANGAKPSADDIANAEWTCQGYAQSIGVPRIFGASAHADPAAEFKAVMHAHVGVAAPHALGDGSILRGIGSILTNPDLWKALGPIILQLASKA